MTSYVEPTLMMLQLTWSTVIFLQQKKQPSLEHVDGFWWRRLPSVSIPSGSSILMATSSEGVGIRWIVGNSSLFPWNSPNRQSQRVFFSIISTFFSSSIVLKVDGLDSEIASSLKQRHEIPAKGGFNGGGRTPASALGVCSSPWSDHVDPTCFRFIYKTGCRFVTRYAHWCLKNQ